MRLKETARSLTRYQYVIVICIIFGVIGTLLLLRASAAPATISIEAEKGTLSSSLMPKSDSAASGSAYVQFVSDTDPIPSSAFWVSPAGSDAASGSQTQPWRTIKKGLESIHPGDTLVIRGGTYTERIVSPNIRSGTAQAPINVRAFPGEKPVVQGLLHLKDAHHWLLDGINVTWDSALTADQNNHMVKMGDGNNWRWTNSEFSNANAYSAVLLSNNSSWQFDNNYIFNTVPVATHGTNQDHLIYISSGMGVGTIERNLFRTSPNGRGIKIGPPDPGTTPIGNVTIRYNTFYDNQGPSNIQVSYGATGNQIYRNIFVKSRSGYANVTAFNLNGTGNVVRDNIGWESKSVVQSGVAGLSDGGGNQFLNPQLANPVAGDFRPSNTAASNYGKYAP